uniref:Uncharacterized protein n=1 Tax=Triticum urartu TaxID=4572 RepID=A0A8R7UMG6_TRIUA
MLASSRLDRAGSLPERSSRFSHRLRAAGHRSSSRQLARTLGTLLCRACSFPELHLAVLLHIVAGPISTSPDRPNPVVIHVPLQEATTTPALSLCTPCTELHHRSISTSPWTGLLPAAGFLPHLICRLACSFGCHPLLPPSTFYASSWLAPSSNPQGSPSVSGTRSATITGEDPCPVYHPVAAAGHGVSIVTSVSSMSSPRGRQDTKYHDVDDHQVQLHQL